MNSSPIHILIVEDSSTDLLIMREALSRTSLNATLHTTTNGEDAMKFLRRVGEYAIAPRPDLILLDIGLPRKNGHEVLSEIKTDPLLLRIPVVILTSSNAEEDISRAYAAHTNCYIRKPVDFEQFVSVMGLIEQFWFKIVTLPAAKPYVH